MGEQDDIVEQQQRLLKIHRQTLAVYIEQRAKFGTTYLPSSVVSGIHEVRDEIRRIKTILRGWSVSMEDYPDDEENLELSQADHPHRLSQLKHLQYIYRLRDDLNSRNTGHWLSNNAILFIARESLRTIRTELHTQDGQIFSGLMPFSDLNIQVISKEIIDFPRLTFRYSDIQDRTIDLGRRLYNLIIPQPVKQGFQTMQDAKVDLVIDPDLQHLPWEIMHDEERFLCFEYGFGRYLIPRMTANSVQEMIGNVQNTTIHAGDVPERNINLLIVCPENNTNNREIDTIREIFYRNTKTVKNTSILTGEFATRDRFFDLLYRGQDIIHCIGDGFYNSNDSRSGLMLHDKFLEGLLDFDIIANVASQHQKSLFFLNICNSASEYGAGYHLALNNEQNKFTVISSLTWIESTLGTHFARIFYSEILAGTPFGEALRLAKIDSSVHLPTTSWWSYVLYGDPSEHI
jgi:hypothetical protein